MTVPVGRNDTQQARELARRLIVWADARDSRNPNGHGKTGTALLRQAAAHLAVLEAERDTLAEAVQAYVDEMDAPARPRITERYRDLQERLSAVVEQPVTAGDRKAAATPRPTTPAGRAGTP